MKAVVYERYGDPSVLRVTEVPTPEPGEGQVLVKVAATSINLSDWERLRDSRSSHAEPMMRWNAHRDPARAPG